MNTESRLSNLLSGFARTLVTDFPIQSLLDHLVVRIVEGPCMAAYSTGASVAVADRRPRLSRQPADRQGSRRPSSWDGNSCRCRGVETVQQRNEVLALDCDLSQGFFSLGPSLRRTESSELHRWKRNRLSRLKHAVPSPLGQEVAK